jgi:hypothetical protein
VAGRGVAPRTPDGVSELESTPSEFPARPVARPYIVNMTEEHRISARRRTLKSGRISFANETCAVDCQIRNLSLTGASLVVPLTVGIPRCFTLTDLHGGTRHKAECVWRKGERMGIRFADVADIPSPVASPIALPRAAPRLKPRHLLHTNAPQTTH